MRNTGTGIQLEAKTYDSESDSFRFQYDPRSVEASMAVVEALAQVIDSDPLELEPLYDSVDNDALDRLFRPREDAPKPAHESIAVSWTHGEHSVTVQATGVITVAPS